jgi:hypothetical protein
MAAKPKQSIDNVLEKLGEIFVDCDENKKKIIAEIKKIERGVVIVDESIEGDEKDSKEIKNLKKIELSANLKSTMFKNLNDVIKLKLIGTKIYKDIVSPTSAKKQDDEKEESDLVMSADDIQNIHDILNKK